MAGAPATSANTGLGVGTVFGPRRESVSGELKNGSVVYSRIFFVYSSSTGWLGSRTGLGWAKRGRARSIGTARSVFIEKTITGRPPGPRGPREQSRFQTDGIHPSIAASPFAGFGVLLALVK